MTALPIEDDGWDPTEPTLPELMEDWDTWAQMHGDEHGLERIVALMLELRERLPDAFDFVHGRLTMPVDTSDRTYPKIKGMMNALHRPSREMNLLRQGITLLYMPRYVLVCPAPGYDKCGLPNIKYREGSKILAMLCNDTINHEFLAIIVDPIMIPKNATICPRCDSIYMRLAQNMLPDGVRVFGNDLHRCKLNPGDFWVQNHVEEAIYDDEDAGLVMDANRALEIFRAWVARTPGVVGYTQVVQSVSTKRTIAREQKLPSSLARFWRQQT
jgi:hypothetical protein